jgi:hypothetical protein
VKTLAPIALSLALAGAVAAQEAPSFQDPTPLKEIESKERNLGPDLVDIDGDGKLDIVAGNYGGVFFVYRNEGEADAPSFGKPSKLQSEGKDLKLKHW